jgi:hypothetical protein
MARSTRTTDKLGAALNRKNPETVLRLLGQTLENARQKGLVRNAKLADTEAKLLAVAAKEHPANAARLSRAAAAARGDMIYAKTVEETLTQIARPDPKGLMLAGIAVPGRTGSAKATIVFANAEGHMIEGSPEIPVRKSGTTSGVVNARELAVLQKILGETQKAFIALKVGKRIVATTSRPFSLKPGGILQFSLRRE